MFNQYKGGNIQYIEYQSALPDNIKLIKANSYSEAFEKMAETILTPPYNMAVWNEHENLLSDELKKFFEKVRDNNLEYKLFLSNNTKDKMIKNVTNHISEAEIIGASHQEKIDCLDEWSTLLEDYYSAANEVWPNHNYDTALRLKEFTYEKSTKPHIDPAQLFESKDSGFPPFVFRLITSNVGKGTFGINNKDVQFKQTDVTEDVAKYTIKSFKNKSPTLWTMKTNALGILSTRHWTHAPIVHGSACSSNDNVKEKRSVFISSFFPKQDTLTL